LVVATAERSQSLPEPLLLAKVPVAHCASKLVLRLVVLEVL
jgi:hypothetical protein